jgi:nitric oxide reductase subunit C
LFDNTRILTNIRNLIRSLIRYTGNTCAFAFLWGDGNINNRTVFSALCVAFVIYSATVYTSGTAATHGESISPAARSGQQVFQDQNCIACHQFYGLGGYMGPDLTNVISTRGEAYSRAFITAGTARMPNFGLNDDEVTALIAYLDFVDQTGTYPPKEYRVLWTGDVAQEDDPR